MTVGKEHIIVLISSDFLLEIRQKIERFCWNLILLVSAEFFAVWVSLQFLQSFSPLAETGLCDWDPQPKFIYQGKLMHSKDYWNLKDRESGKYVKL